MKILNFLKKKQPEVKSPPLRFKITKNDSYLAPFDGAIGKRYDHMVNLKNMLTAGATLSDFSNGHKFYGLHKTKHEWIFREWAPSASRIFFVGGFSHWQEQGEFELKRTDSNGTWEIRLNSGVLKHLDFYKLKIYWQGGSGERIPTYANYVTQDAKTHVFSAQVWNPPEPYQFKHTLPNRVDEPIIYESHIGMASQEGKVATYQEFREKILPYIKSCGYNTVQIMAVQEHPYYGSFGYQVSNFFAPSSRFGTPCELKQLIDRAHELGLRVIMDIVHSHAVKNENEGLGLFDGTSYQFFHDGGRGNHSAWDTKCFNYGKHQVVHFLLSNVKYWMEEFKFDGFRFDGVTSMMYLHHGLGKGFSGYGDYFNEDVDEDAIIYLMLANSLIHEINPCAISIAEDVSGLPGLAYPVDDGGVGFDYVLAMGIPDFWVRTLKTMKDEDWNMDHLFSELTNRRHDQKTITYVESHDQALVGDKTVIFWLVDAQMYWNFSKDRRNYIIDRGIALHKLIRLITLTTGRGGYLNFMGNEFGHPEWIDFPRIGNNWSYHYARRQWDLKDNGLLCYEYLLNFDKFMIKFVRETNLLSLPDPQKVWSHCDDKTLGYKRGDYLFIYNFHGDKSYTDYSINVENQSEYKLIMHSDTEEFGGFSRLTSGQTYHVIDGKIKLYLPNRTVLILKPVR